MEIKELLREEKSKAKQHDMFWGLLISIVSISEGMFILYHNGLMSERLDVYLLGIDENIFGWALVIFASLKLSGIVYKRNNFRAIGIVGLSAVWGMLFTVSVLWSFGIGYPSNSFISNGLSLIICLRISYKGVFNGMA